MNWLNGMMGLIIADSRAKYYQVNNPQSIKAIGLIVGMKTKNPLMSYLLIENLAKNPNTALDALPELMKGMNLTLSEQIQISKDFSGKLEELDDKISPLNITLNEIKDVTKQIHPRFLKPKNKIVVEYLASNVATLNNITRSAFIYSGLQYIKMFEKAEVIRNHTSYESLRNNQKDLIDALIKFKAKGYNELMKIIENNEVDPEEIFSEGSFLGMYMLSSHALDEIEKSLDEISLANKKKK